MNEQPLANGGKGPRSLAPVTTSLVAGLCLFVIHALLNHNSDRKLWNQQLCEYARQGAELLSGMTIDGAGSSGSTGAFHPWAATLLASDNIDVIACFDKDGKMISALPTGSEATVPADLLQTTVELGSTPASGLSNSRPGVGVATITGFPTGMTMGYVVVTGPGTPSLATLGSLGSIPVQAAIFMGSSLLVGLGGVALSVRSRSSALKILVPRDGQSPRAWHATLPTRRQDDVGHVARMLDRMYSDLDSTRSELQSLKKSLDARVDERTRQVKAMLQRAEEKAWKDPLTQLGNRRLLEERLESIYQAQVAAKDDLSIVMIDLDHFKQLNDTSGHAAGDELLSFLGMLLRGTLRPTDIGIRYGGDEFCLLLLGVDAEQACTAAERIAKLFAQHSGTLSVTPKPSLSVGVASLSGTATQSGSELLSKADSALYAAKRAGRNRVQRDLQSAAIKPRRGRTVVQ